MSRYRFLNASKLTNGDLMSTGDDKPIQSIAICDCVADLEVLGLYQLKAQHGYWSERLKLMKNVRLAAYTISLITLLITLIAYFVPPIDYAAISSLTGFLVPLVTARLLRHHIADARRKIGDIERLIESKSLTLKKSPIY